LTRHSVAAQVGADSLSSAAVPFGAADSLRFARDVNRYVASRDARGGVVHVFPKFANAPPLDTAAFWSARENRPAWVTGTWRGRGARSFYAPPAST
jgi:hypothetical protein